MTVSAAGRLDGSGMPEDRVRRSYDTVAEEYTRRIAGELKGKPLDRALLGAFGEMVYGRGLVADIGCGPGHVGRYLFDRGLPVVGIDLSPGMIEIARRLNPGMTFTVSSMLNLPARRWRVCRDHRLLLDHSPSAGESPDRRP